MWVPSGVSRSGLSPIRRDDRRHDVPCRITRQRRVDPFATASAGPSMTRLWPSMVDYSGAVQNADVAFTVAVLIDAEFVTLAPPQIFEAGTRLFVPVLLHHEAELAATEGNRSAATELMTRASADIDLDANSSPGVSSMSSISRPRSTATPEGAPDRSCSAATQEAAPCWMTQRSRRIAPASRHFRRISTRPLLQRHPSCRTGPRGARLHRGRAPEIDRSRRPVTARDRPRGACPSSGHEESADRDQSDRCSRRRPRRPSERRRVDRGVLRLSARRTATRRLEGGHGVRRRSGQRQAVAAVGVVVAVG